MNPAPHTSVLSGFPEAFEIFPVSTVELRVRPGPHPLYAEREAEIAENWQREVAANPALYNGELVFLRQATLEGDGLVGEGHLVPYATHLWWRRQADRRGGAHAFAWAIPVSSDGAVIAIRMGPTTANPGLVYCAAGSLEAEDIVDGVLDVTGNMRREVLEETGLDLAEAHGDARYFGMMSEEVVMLFRVYHFGLTAEEMLSRIRLHMQQDHEKEIEAAIAIRNADPAAHRYSRFMPPILRQVLGDGAI